VRTVFRDNYRGNAEGARGAFGNDGAEGLAAWLESTRAAWTEDLMIVAVDRFERRMTTDISAVRVDVARETSTLRVDVARDIAALRGEWLKWSFLFWVGQVATGMLAYMLRP
jgi:hypothetical protein